MPQGLPHCSWVMRLPLVAAPPSRRSPTSPLQPHSAPADATAAASAAIAAAPDVAADAADSAASAPAADAAAYAVDAAAAYAVAAAGDAAVAAASLLAGAEISARALNPSHCHARGQISADEVLHTASPVAVAASVAVSFLVAVVLAADLIAASFGSDAVSAKKALEWSLEIPRPPVPSQAATVPQHLDLVWIKGNSEPYFPYYQTLGKL